ncbi:ribonuclease H-like domain-containing protein [Tanacetum coccineum]
MERELGEGYSFIKKKCFVCGSLSHLIKDCDFYEKKMAREAELKKQRVINTGNGVAKPVWNNANRVNHANHFVPRPVQLNAGRPNINSVRPNINTGRTNVNSVRPRVNTGSSNVNTVRSRQPVPTRTSNSFSPKRPQGNWGTAVKTSAGYNWRNSRPNSNCDSGPTFIRTVNAKGHMTGNKDHLDDFEECKGGSVTFGGSKGYITGKGRIRVGNLDFDSVSFVKELGHFNLFSISQICDKHHKVLFTETECLVVSPDFKMPDENQILLKVPSQQKYGLGHINFNNLNKLVKGNLVRGPRFCWVFFLSTKDETSGILQNFIRQIEKPAVITGNKGIKQEYSNARTPQQNGVAERMNRTLIEAARTMLADSLLPTTFWAKAVSTACYIFNRAFRRDLDQLAQKHLREVTTDKATSTNSVNSGSEPANTQPANQDDSDMPELTIFNKHYKREFDAASYDEEEAELKQTSGATCNFKLCPKAAQVTITRSTTLHVLHVFISGGT